ncbi:protein of unknown function [Neorhodopirellula lusitana]|uniref:DUF4349 domain-containing protein n=1 Tax=Neorhodopirellula lusitana TaxID=445327 RepID=A0ABY1QPD0_9BACT|nr:DUF4349 domain-containing protein [Neorhodopirellula lusitana]SMP74889.1 protein of unknown function [Neorhodopirellula lusitana]
MLRRYRFFQVALVVLIPIAGCGQQSNQFSSKLNSLGEQAEYEESSPATAVGRAPNQNATSDVADGESNESAKLNRRIVYNTKLSLVVKEYSVFESTLPGLVERHGGFISKSETSRRFNDQQSGVWVARIPVASYADFLQGVSGLGFAESRTEDAQDITAEFIDVEARIRNNKKLEERIITMLKERTGKLSDVLDIERELSRVREEIERMEGRLRVLADRSAMATITIRCREEKEYVPPKSPTLGSRAQRSWAGSISTLRATGENLVVAGIAIVPWLIVLAVPLFIVVVVARRVLRKRTP